MAQFVVQKFNTRLTTANWRLIPAMAVGLALVVIAVLVLQTRQPDSAADAGRIQSASTTVPAQTRQSPLARAAIRAAANDVAPDLPGFLQAPFLHASLSALEANGANLSDPMPSNHWIRSETEATAQDLVAWAAANNFLASEPTIFLGHGGTEFFEVALTRIDIPNVEKIQQQGRTIRAGLAGFDNARYTTWVGALTSTQ